MLNNWLQALWSTAPTISTLVAIITGIVNIIFAGAVAKDAGQLTREDRKTILVSPMVWAFATLVGGVFIAIAYWLIHHLNLYKK